MRTFVSISSCGYLNAQSSIIGERRTEMYSSPNVPSRPSLPQRPDSTHSSLKVLNWPSQRISTYQRGHAFSTTGTKTTLSNGSFPIKENSDLGPQSFLKSIARPTSPHQQTSESHNQYQPPSVQTSNPIHQQTTHHPPHTQPHKSKTTRANPSINTPTPSYHPLLTPSAQTHLGKANQV